VPLNVEKKVVQRRFVRQVDDREAQTPFVPVTAQKIVIAHAGIKQVPRHNAMRIVVVVFFLGCGYFDQGGSEGACGARGQRRSRGAWSARPAVASESGL
jgi:hypothetical protein